MLTISACALVVGFVVFIEVGNHQASGNAVSMVDYIGFAYAKTTISNGHNWFGGVNWVLELNTIFPVG